MTQILHKHPPALSIRAGKLARQLIQSEGLQAEQVDIVPGAAGGPKGIGIQGLDQAIFGEFFAPCAKMLAKRQLPMDEPIKVRLCGARCKSRYRTFR